MTVEGEREGEGREEGEGRVRGREKGEARPGIICNYFWN